VSATQIAALIAALAFLLLVGALLVPILKLRHTVDAATRALDEVASRTGPLLSEAHDTLDGVNSAVTQLHTTLDGVNAQLDRLDTISGHAEQITGAAARVSTIVAGASESPLVKAAAFGYGVRKSIGARRHAAADRQVRGRLAGERRKTRKARGAGVVRLLRRAAAHRRAAAGAGERNV
jgi:uncharacterized protein YoxC